MSEGRGGGGTGDSSWMTGGLVCHSDDDTMTAALVLLFARGLWRGRTLLLLELPVGCQGTEP